MTTITHSSARAFAKALLLCSALTVVFSCQDIKDITTLDPLKDVVFTIDANPYTAPVLVQFTNANRDAKNQPGDFAVTITGKDADKVVMTDGTRDFKSVGGRVPLGIRSKVTPSAANPITFTVAADIPGFTSLVQNITLADTSASTLQFAVVELANPADGTSVITKQAPVTNGQSTAPVTLTAPETATKKEEAVLTIPANTQLLDAQGKAVGSGTLAVQMVHYATTANESEAAFPGGFVADNVVNQSGQAQAGGVTFVTGGFVAIDMKVGNTEVKSFSKPIDVKVELEDNLTNPLTDAPVNAGETIPVWSLNTDTGQWREEGTATVTRGADGKLTAQFQAAHLSWWNLDWGYSGVRDCPNRTLTINFKANVKTTGLNYEVQLQTENGSYLAGLHDQPVYDGLSLKLLRSPSYPRVKIVVYDISTGRVLGSTGLFNPCNTSSITVTATLPLPPDFTNVVINFSALCTKKHYQARPSAWIYLNRVGASFSDPGAYISLYAITGVARLRVINGATYNVAAYYNGKWESATVTFNKATVPLLSSGGITGTASYNATADLTTVNATATIKDCE